VQHSKTLLPPNLPENQAAKGVTEASVSIYPTITHCTVEIGAENSLASTGVNTLKDILPNCIIALVNTITKSGFTMERGLLDKAALFAKILSFSLMA
jgi:hypothetical protein